MGAAIRCPDRYFYKPFAGGRAFIISALLKSASDAAMLGLVPELRARNLIAPYSKTVNHLNVTSCALDECLRRVVDASGYAEKHGVV